MANNTSNDLKDYVSHLYIMYYRKGMIPNLTRVFHFNGDLTAARKRADEHCRRLPDHRLNFVTPFITDLDEFEKTYGRPPAPNPILTVMQEGAKL